MHFFKTLSQNRGWIVQRPFSLIVSQVFKLAELDGAINNKQVSTHNICLGERKFSLRSSCFMNFVEHFWFILGYFIVWILKTTLKTHIWISNQCWLPIVIQNLLVFLQIVLLLFFQSFLHQFDISLTV